MEEAATASDNQAGKDAVHTMSRRREHLLIVLSLLFAAVAPVVLWYSRGDPLLALWRLCFLLSSYFFPGAAVISPTATRVVFFYFSGGASLAFFVEAVLSPAGLIIMCLVSLVAAVQFDCALREHLRRSVKIKQDQAYM